MAWRAKIVNASAMAVPAKDDNGNDITTDISLQGNVWVDVSYFDSAAPAVELAHASFTGPANQADMQARIVAYGQKVRDCRTVEATLKGLINTVIPVP